MKFCFLLVSVCLFLFLNQGQVSQVNAQYTPGNVVFVDDLSISDFSTHFVCASIDPLLGYALVSFKGGRNAYPGNTLVQKAVLFADGTQTPGYSTAFTYTRAYNQPGTHWAYLRDLSTSDIVDYVQIEIVTHSVYSGDCMTRMTTDESGNPAEDGGPYPPVDWDSGSLPPAYTPSSN